MNEILLTDILVEDRQRKDYGDIESLAESIKDRVGLIQPIVLAKLPDGKFRLTAGGRRYEALKLAGYDRVYHGFTCNKDRPGFVFDGESTDADVLFEIELAENTERKSMTWQEEVLNIAKVHHHRKRKNALASLEWTYAQTGRLIGLSVAKVGYTLKIASELTKDPDGPVAKAATYSDALKVLIQRQEDAVNAELAARTLAAAKDRAAIPAPSKVKPAQSEADGPELPPDLELMEEAPQDELVVPLTSMVHLGDCLKYLETVKSGTYDHCFTDTPYAIDMDNLEQNNPHGGMNDIDRIRETHDVDQNLEFLSKLIPEVFRVTKDNSFFVTWCDQMTWQFLYDTAIKAGWRVQRWPITWQKMHQCMNQMAQYNTTKNTEIAMVMRKPGATLAKNAQSSVIMASNDKERKKFGHPFVKPFECWEYFGRHMAIPGQTILEPCAGVGSGVLSFLQMGYQVDACEIDEKHYNKLLLNVQEFYTNLHPKCKFV